MDRTDLVFKAASIYAKNRPVKAEDLISYGWFGLQDAEKKYKPELGKFESYALQRIFGAITDGLRRENHTRVQNPIVFEPLEEDLYDSGVMRIDTLVDKQKNNPMDIVTATETAQELQDLIQELPEKERVTIESVFYEGFKSRDLAKKYKVSDARVGQWKKQALATLRARWCPDDLSLSG